MLPVEFGIWLGGIWFFGLVVTGGVFSFNLHSVRAGDPTIPYILLGIGYIGLILTTLLFAVRFLQAFEQRQNMLQVLQNTDNENLRVIDLKPVIQVRDKEKLILDAFNRLNYGEAFVMVSDKNLSEQHPVLHKVLGVSFAWESLEEGPQEWKVKIGKLN